MNIKTLTIAALFASTSASALEATVGECTGDRLHEIYPDSATAQTQLEHGAQEVVYMEDATRGIENDTHVTMCRAGQLTPGESTQNIGATDVFVIGPDDTAVADADNQQAIRYGWKMCWNAVQNGNTQE